MEELCNIVNILKTEILHEQLNRFVNSAFPSIVVLIDSIGKANPYPHSNLL